MTRFSFYDHDATQSECAHLLLLRYPSYGRNHACALPSPLPFHYVMVKIVLAMQSAAHAKSNTLYGRSYCVKSSFFRLDAFLLFRIIMELHFARCELRYFCACCICTNSRLAFTCKSSIVLKSILAIFEEKA